MNEFTQNDIITCGEQPIGVDQKSVATQEMFIFESNAIEFIENKLNTFIIGDITRYNYIKAKLLFQSIARVNMEAARYLLWKISKICRYVAGRCICESAQFDSYKDLVLTELHNDNRKYLFSHAVDDILVSILFDNFALFSQSVKELDHLNESYNKNIKLFMTPADLSSQQMGRFINGLKGKTIYWSGIIHLIATEIKNDSETLKFLEYSAFTSDFLLKEVLECSNLNIKINKYNSTSYVQLIDKLCDANKVSEASMIIIRLGLPLFEKFSNQNINELQEICMLINNEYQKYNFGMHIAIKSLEEDKFALQKFRDELFPRLSDNKGLVSIYCMSILHEMAEKGSIFFGFKKECERFISYIPEDFDTSIELFKLIIQCQEICLNSGENVAEFLKCITHINVCRHTNTSPINRKLKDYAEGLRVPSAKHIQNLIGYNYSFSDICFIYFNSYIKLGYKLQKFCSFCIEQGISISDINTEFSRFTLTGGLRGIKDNSILVRLMNTNAEYIWGSSSAVLCELGDLKGKLLSFNIRIDAVLGPPRPFAYNIDMYSAKLQTKLLSHNKSITLIDIGNLSRLYKRLAEKAHIPPKIYEEIRSFQIGDIFEESVTMPKKLLLDAIWIRRSLPQEIIHLIKGISLRNPFCAKRIPVNNYDGLQIDDAKIYKQSQELASSLARNVIRLSDAIFIYINTSIKLIIEFIQFIRDCCNHHHNNFEDEEIIYLMYSCGIIKKQNDGEFVFYPDDFLININITIPYNLIKSKSIYCDVPIIAQLSINARKDKVSILVIDLFDEVSYFASDAYWEMCYSALICDEDGVEVVT